MLDSGLINQLLPPLIFAVFAAGFLAIWFFNRHFRSAGLFAISYTCGVLAFSFEAFLGSITPYIFLQYVGDIFYVLTSVIFTLAIAVRYDQKLPLTPVITIGFVTISLQTWFHFIDPDLVMRSEIISFGSSMILAMSLLVLWGAKRKWIDDLLIIMIFCFCTALAANTITVLHVFGETLANHSFSSSLFLAGVNFIVSAASLCMAVLLFISYGSDLVTQLHHQSTTDLLSNLLNRRGFESRAFELINHANQKSEPLSLIICDIDHFKQVNDEYGHVVGDQVIKDFGRVISNSCRLSDLVGRVGGEEFCLLLPTANLSVARSLAEDLRSKLAETKIEGIAPDDFVKASFGVAQLENESDYQTLFKQADAALYQAKQEGRNRVAIYDSDEFKNGSIQTTALATP